MIRNTQTLFKELNKGKLPRKLIFFSGGTIGGNELRFHALQNIGTLNESNEHFIDYLSSDFAREVLSKNKMKIHLDTGNIYYNNLNMRENIYSFMHVQQDETKKFINFDIDINDGLEFYLNEMIAGVSDNKFDIDTHSTSKFLLRCDLENLRHDLSEEACKVRYAILSDNLHSLQSLQSKDWSYFINHLLEVSSCDVSLLNLNDAEEIKIINDTVENLKICKNYYTDIYANVISCFQNYLGSAPDVLIHKIQDDLRLNLYSNIDLKNEVNTREILETFDRFFFVFARFPAINELIYVPTGHGPSFVKLIDIISPSELYKRFNSGDTRGLDWVHFLVALNVHLGGDKMISKNAMSEFFHNLSMQALSKSDDTIVIKFDAINKLKSLNNLLMAKSLAFNTEKISRMATEFFHRPIFVAGEQTDNKKIEENIVRSILNCEKMVYI